MKTPIRVGMRIAYLSFRGNDGKGLTGTVVAVPCVIDWDNLGKGFMYGYKFLEDAAGVFKEIKRPLIILELSEDDGV